MHGLDYGVIELLILLTQLRALSIGTYLGDYTEKTAAGGTELVRLYVGTWDKSKLLTPTAEPLIQKGASAITSTTRPHSVAGQICKQLPDLTLS